MNIRKDIDYSEMYAELDKAMAADITQMELYCEIGKAVCRRTEKGAAVAAAAYLSRQYEKIVLDFDQKVCDNEAVRNDYSVTYRGCSFAQTLIFHLHSYWERSKRTISYSVFTNRPIAFMRC